MVVTPTELLLHLARLGSESPNDRLDRFQVLKMVCVKALGHNSVELIENVVRMTLTMKQNPRGTEHMPCLQEGHEGQNRRIVVSTRGIVDKNDHAGWHWNGSPLGHWRCSRQLDSTSHVRFESCGWRPPQRRALQERMPFAHLSLCRCDQFLGAFGSVGGSASAVSRRHRVWSKVMKRECSAMLRWVQQPQA